MAAALALRPPPSSGEFETNPELDAVLGGGADEKPPETPTPAAAPAEDMEKTIMSKAQKASETIAGLGEEAAALKAPEAPKFEAAPTPKTTDPIESFGSLASVFALIGSAMTKQPMLHALNNAAGVLEAYKTNDAARAKQEYDLWKANTDYALRIAQQENSAYQTAIANIQSKGKLAADEVEVIASAYGNSVMRDLARARNYQGMQENALKMDEMRLKIAALQPELDAMQEKAQLWSTWNAENPDAQAAEKIAAYQSIYNPSKTGVAATGPTSEGGNIQLPDGRVVKSAFMKGVGNVYKEAGPDGTEQWVPIPAGSRQVTVSAGSLRTEKDFQKLESDLVSEKNALKALNNYFNSVGGLDSGMARWANSLSASFKTFLGSQGLTPEQFNQLKGRSQLQALLGAFRTTVVGPGVMTEQDAQRVIEALGGDPASALQNPRVLYEVLKDVYARKYDEMMVLKKSYDRNAPLFNEAPRELDIPPRLGGKTAKKPASGESAPAGGAQPPSRASTPPAAAPIPIPPTRADILNAPEDRVILLRGQKYRRQGTNLVPVEAPSGPAGGPAVYTPMAPIEDAEPAPAAPPRQRTTPTPTPAAAASPAKPTPAASIAEADPTSFLSYTSTAPVQTARPGAPPTPALLPSQSAIAASKRNVPIDSSLIGDIEMKRRGATARFDAAAGRKQPENDAKTAKKPTTARRYKITRAADGSTVVEVLTD